MGIDSSLSIIEPNSDSIPRSADFSGWTGYQTMDGNSNLVRGLTGKQLVYSGMDKLGGMLELF